MQLLLRLDVNEDVFWILFESNVVTLDERVFLMHLLSVFACFDPKILLKPAFNSLSYKRNGGKLCKVSFM
jgi:hypothetical protein